MTPAVVRAPEPGGMRKAVAGEARTGDADVKRACRRRAQRGGGVSAAKPPKAASRGGILRSAMALKNEAETVRYLVQERVVGSNLGRGGTCDDDTET